MKSKQTIQTVTLSLLMLFGLHTCLLAQNLDVEGNAKISVLNLENGADSIVVWMPDGVLAYRDAYSLQSFQVLSISNDTIYLSNGGFVKLPQDQVDDADNDPNNEIQSLSIVDDTLFLSNGGGQIPEIKLFDQNIGVVKYTGHQTHQFVFPEDLPSGGSTTANIFMYNPNRHAFWAGRLLNSDHWNSNNLGSSSTAFGLNPLASGETSFAAGKNVEATGKGSVAFGDASIASGTVSFAHGKDIHSEAFFNAAFGRYNVGGGDPTQWQTSDPVFEVGIGADNANRENALTILKDGTVLLRHYELPNNSGAKDQIMRLDAAGELYWDVDLVNDADADDTNEIQTISKSGSTVTLSNGGGAFQDATGAWTESMDTTSTSKYVGIGTSTPSEKLQGDGAIVVGNNSNTSPVAGTIRWNATTEDFEGYDGYAWRSLTSAKVFGNKHIRSTEDSIIQAETPVALEYLGSSVDISGSTVISGAFGSAQSSNQNGTAYLFHLNNGSLARIPLLLHQTVLQGINLEHLFQLTGIILSLVLTEMMILAQTLVHHMYLSLRQELGLKKPNLLPLMQTQMIYLGSLST